MNAAVWAIIKLAAARDIAVVGVRAGYDGLIDGHFEDLTRELDGDGFDWLAGTGGTFVNAN